MKTLVKNFIGGKWVGAHSGRTFDSRDPATGEVVGRCVDSGPEDIDEAMKAATEAFEGWRRMPAPRRGEILFRVAERLMRDKETLARTVTREMGKVLAEAKGDVQEAIDMAYYMAAEGRRQFGLVVPSELPDKSALCVREPVGVVGLITPWNFPIAIPSWKTFPALILGNTVVLKPSPETPVTASLFVQVLEECGAPPGVVNLVLGSSPELGAALVRHSNVALISFTGSTATGGQVAMDAAAGHKRVALEMGGKNAILVMDDADLDLAVDGITWSAFGTTGQRCTACSRLLVHREVKERLTRMLLNRMAKLTVGNGLKPGVEIGPLVNQAQMERAQRAMRDIRTAIVYINAGTIGSEVHLPFGGMRRTGNGHREAGQAALDTFSEWKAIYVDYSGRLQRAQIDKD